MESPATSRKAKQILIAIFASDAMADKALVLVVRRYAQIDRPLRVGGLTQKHCSFGLSPALKSNQPTNCFGLDLLVRHVGLFGPLRLVLVISVLFFFSISRRQSSERRSDTIGLTGRDLFSTATRMRID